MSMTNYTFTFNVSGQIRNEGARATSVKNVEIGLTYTLKNGKKFSFSIMTNNFSDLGWQNSSFEDKQSKRFFLSITVEYAWYAQIEPNQKPDEGWIRIKHHDGIDIQIQSSIFK